MNKNTYLTVKDHPVSGEVFQLLYDDEFDMLITSPQPSEDELPKCYKSQDYISHTDTQRNLFEKLYHFIRRISLKKKLKLINLFFSEEKMLLDIGCGTGEFLKIAQQNNWTVFGIEPNEKARSIANKKTNNSVSDIEKLSNFKPQSFDVITLWHVLEHLPRLEEHISILKSLLKSNGTLIITVPNYKSYDAKYYKEFWAAYDAPRHLWHFSQSSISKLVVKENMQVFKTLPMKFDSYYVSLLSEKYKSGSMNIFNALRIGWLSNFKARQSTEFSSLIFCVKNS